MDAINWNQLAVALAGLAVTCGLWKANKWYQARVAYRRRISKALRSSVMYREVGR